LVSGWWRKGSSLTSKKWGRETKIIGKGRVPDLNPLNTSGKIQYRRRKKRKIPLYRQEKRRASD